MLIRFVPGLIAALAAYVALWFIGWMNYGWIHAAIFFGVYLFVAIAVDKGMSSYRKSPGKN